MIKKLSFVQRFQAALALLVVFLLIFATNRLDARHFEAVQETINTVYDDRVVAQDYIYQLSNLYHRKALRIATGEDDSVANENAEIAELLAKFAQTKLTPQEHEYFERLKQDHKALLKQEEGVPSQERDAAIAKILISVEKGLNDLASVQIQESRRQTELAQTFFNASNLHSRIEIGFLVVIGLLMQVLVLVRPWK